jgi:hypothetical protein
MFDMWPWIWIIIGAVGWLWGYYRAGIINLEGSQFIRSFIRPPFFIYLLCGLPSVPTNPKGVIATSSVLGQLGGIIFITYGILYGYLPNQNLQDILHHVFILFILSNGIYFLCWILYKHYPYSAS